MSLEHYRIERLAGFTDEAFSLLNEYYDAIGVQQRDNAEAVKVLAEDPRCGLWLARDDKGVAVGCVALRPLPSIAQAGECKRLYVRAQARGLGLASQLMEVLETAAQAMGYSAVFLDSRDDLQAAVALYRSRGYEPCERYNDNSQVTIFLRKLLSKEQAAS